MLPSLAFPLMVWASIATAVPVLGHSWGPNQEGYGKARPAIVYNGGDPTGMVTNIRWTSWGGKEAIGAGTSTWVWPGTCVGCNRPIAGARIVAFHRGQCRGAASYNAVEWFFPKYGETFNPHVYINACTGAYVGYSGTMPRCSNATTKDGRVAFKVQATGLSCRAAKQVIATAAVIRYLRHAGRFLVGRFRCGTEGDLAGAAIFECALGNRDLLFEVTA